MRLIDADALNADFIQRYTANADVYLLVRKILNDAPTVDAVEVVHGEWIAQNCQIIWDWSIGCSVCGYCERRGPAYEISEGMYNYCPRCGSKMDGVRTVSE